MVTKDEAARTLAGLRYEGGDGVTHVYRLVGAAEDDPDEPIKLLNDSESREPIGFHPLGFRPMPALGVPYRYILLVVSPGELVDIRGGRLELPRGWKLGEEFPRPAFEPEPDDAAADEWADEPEPV
ncbi:MAG: hypothetical protein K2X87_15230 [Gemmataceae bacterium]|nr:hypothetical protein [Gemmataceae bacterium]